MRHINLRLTVLTGLVAVIASAVLFHATNPGFEFICLWTGPPYLAHCGIGHAMRRDRHASMIVLIGTVLSAVSADLAYFDSNWPIIEGRSQGVEVMNCFGPVVEFGVPIFQWLFFGLLWAVANASRSPKVA